MSIPDPLTRFPMPGIARLAFLKPVVTSPLIDVGDFTYYDDPDGPEAFERNVLYHFDFIGDRLRIGKFSQIAAKATFVMNGANHPQGGLSTFPFFAFGGDWAAAWGDAPTGESKGDTLIGNDVWIGTEAMILPGITVGDGAVIGARAVVTADVAPYTIVAGNPARPIRLRVPEDVAARLLALRWWDWPVSAITAAVGALAAGDIDALEALAPSGERNDSFRRG
jgi:virginiamycin A acetyltransferase